MRRIAVLGAIATVIALCASRVDAEPATVVTATLAHAASEAVAEVRIAPGWHVNADRPRDEFLIPTSLAVVAPPGVRAGTPRYPEPVARTLAFSADTPLLLFEGTVRISVPLTGTATPGGPPLRATLRYQACNDTTCLPPRTLELVAADPTGPGAGPGPDANPVARWIARWGLGLTLGWVALLGLALNLTPCVYPMIGVTVAFFGGRAGTDRRRALGHALVYALGICATFAALGVAAALTGSLFGAALQRPAVLGAIALFMTALALSSFGLYQIRVPQGVMRFASRAGEGVGGALFMGLTMGVVGAPCIGPIVAALLLYVGAVQSVLLGFLLFTALGLGLGAPYVALALVAQELRRLPRSGPWLERMEWLFGFLLLGLALHFATPLLPTPLVRAGGALLLVVGGLTLGFRGHDGATMLRRARRAAGVAVAVAGVVGWLRPEPGPGILWAPYSDAAIVEAARAGRPVLIDFEATWCLPCREMDHTTWRDPSVVVAARDFTTLKADVTAQTDAATALMKRFTVAGVPTYVLLDRAGREHARLVGFVAAERMREALDGASRG